MSNHLNMARAAAMLVALVTICLTQRLVQSEVLSQADEQRLTTLIQQVMECRDIPGLTMTIARGKEYKTIPLGVANKATGEKVNSRTLFYMGAITQSFTATLLAELIQRSTGVLHFDTPIAQLIGGEFQLSSKILTEQITLRDALTHRTGLSTGSIAGLTGLPQAMSRAEVISQLKELPQQAHFRDDFNFNQFMYTLAAYVGEKISGSSWEKLMRTHILDKLLMTSTLVATDDTTGPDFARSYVSEEGKMVEVPPQSIDIGPLAPAGTMYTNAEDMAKALKFYLGDPHLIAQVKIAPPLLEELMNPRVVLPVGFRASLDRSSHMWPVSDVNVGYGMGFFRNIYRGFQVPWMANSVHGFTSIMWLVPERNVGIFIAVNGQKHTDLPLATVQTLTYFATDLLLGFEPWINETSACLFPEPFIKTPELPDVEFKPQPSEFALTDYQGIFTSKLLGDITVRKSTSNPKALTFTMGKITGTLLPEGGNIFRLFLEGDNKYMQTPLPGKNPLPFTRLLFEFKGTQCTGLKLPDSIYGGSTVDFTRTQSFKEEL
ncbi:beta-lactamase-like [Physella acuta]|uniref:beta-lactamase-like n=1 Tax=Physella acuta TaxID=109671 RepID=UPI0027DAE7D6|nr:beta-lactamase-like [Physella acuta]